MWLKEVRKYFGLIVAGIILIAIYKTFDSFGYLVDGIKLVLKILTPVFAGFFVAYILRIPCRKIEALLLKTKKKFFLNHCRGIAVAIIYALFFLLIIATLWAILPSLIKSITDLVEQMPTYFNNFVSWFNSFGIYTLDVSSAQNLLKDNLANIQALLSEIDVKGYAEGVMNVGSAVFNFMMAFIISVYALAGRTSFKRIALRVCNSFIPPHPKEILFHYLRKIDEFITLYVSCQLVDGLIIFILSFIALTIMRVRYAPILALMIGLFNLIPCFGAIVACTIAALSAVFTGGFLSGVIVAVVLIVLQQLDANFIQPKILGSSLNIKPIWVIFSILLGGGLFGFIGIFLSVPVFALFRLICADILEYRERKKGLTAAKETEESEPSPPQEITEATKK